MKGLRNLRVCKALNIAFGTEQKKRTTTPQEALGKLLHAYPDLPLVTLVDSDRFSQESSWLEGTISKVERTKIVQGASGIWLKDDLWSDVIEDVMGVSKIALEDAVTLKELQRELPWKTVILIHIR